MNHVGYRPSSQPRHPVRLLLDARCSVDSDFQLSLALVHRCQQLWSANAVNDRPAIARQPEHDAVGRATAETRLNLPSRFLECQLPSIAIYELERIRRAIAKYRSSNRTAIRSCGINVDPVCFDLRLKTMLRCMAVYYQPIVLASIRKKWLPNPEEITFQLLTQRPSKVDAGMNEKPQVVFIVVGKTFHPFQVSSGNFSRFLNAITDQRSVAAHQQEPIRWSAVQYFEKGGLMIAAKADYFFARLLQANENIDDTAAVGTPIDVITDKNKTGIGFSIIALTIRKEAQKLIFLSVNVADCKC
jgi:hypothetical protein